MTTLRFLLHCTVLVQLFVLGYAQYRTRFVQTCDGKNLEVNCRSQYINIKSILYGSFSLKNDSSCSTVNDTSEECLMPDPNSNITDECQGKKNCTMTPLFGDKVVVRCNKEGFKNLTEYVVVEYSCEDYELTTTSTTSTTSTTTTTTTGTSTTTTSTTTAAPTTRWEPSTTTEYQNFLSTGAQAGIIVAIMVGLTIIFAAITVYKCVKYGPSDDTRKFFSRPPEPGAEEDPKIIPWVPGEAQEEIYRNITEKAKAKKKRKFKF